MLKPAFCFFEFQPMENMGHREIERKVVLTRDKYFYSRLTRGPHVNSYVTYHWYTCVAVDETSLKKETQIK